MAGEGNALFARGRYQEAVDAYEQARCLDPNYALAYFNKGRALNAVRRYQEASAAYEQARRLDPNLGGP